MGFYKAIWRQRLLSGCWILAACLLFASKPLGAANLTPHRAIYSLKMGESRSNSSFVSAKGSMALVLEKSCDGWILTQNLAMDLDTPEGAVVSQRSRFTGLESADGKAYRFASNNDTQEENKRYKGNAIAGGSGSPGEAVFNLPEKKTMPLPEQTLFPIAQTSWVIDQAIAGVRHAPHYVFDGSDGSGPREAAAFIGPQLHPNQESAGKAEETAPKPLTERPGWNIRIAFYPLEGQEAEPEYEIEVLQLDNGVAQRMLLDYGDLTVIMELEKIEAINPPSC